MGRERIIFWLDMASPHQSPYMRALADLLPEKRIVCVFEKALSSDRLALGWSSPDLGRVEIVSSPAQAMIQRLASEDPADTIHIFGGVRLPMVRRALDIAAPTSARIGLLSEARHWRGWRGRLRLLHSHFVERRYRSRADFVLAIGHLAVCWYELCGYSDRQIFPWGYIVEPYSIKHAPSPPDNRLADDVVISFVGRFILGKGVDTLIHALAVLVSLNWRLQLIGDGLERQSLETLVDNLGITERVCFTGIKKNAGVFELLAHSDLFVFPSEIDGWGAVVNEALMSGVPVVCSDYCGAADLIRTSGHGELFRAGSTEDLARVLAKWIEKGSLKDTQRSEIQAWSKCIEGEIAARYLIDIIRHVDEGGERPVAPWLRAGDTEKCAG